MCVYIKSCVLHVRAYSFNSVLLILSVSRAVAVLTDDTLSEDTNCDVNALGEAAAEIINIETVTFFFSHKKDMLFVECCLKENLEKEIAAVQKRGFCSHSAPSPDFLLKTINGRAEINVSVTGDLNLRGGDVMIVFEKNLDTARHSDFLDGRVQPSSKMCGYVRFSITPEYMAQCLESNKDGYFSVMPITIVNRNQVIRKRYSAKENSH